MVLAPTPYLGVDSWYAYGSKIDDSVIRSMVDLVVSTGMRDAGYRYVWLDAGWPAGRNPDGSIALDGTQWPDGLDGLCEYIHSQGLSAGIYIDAGPSTSLAFGSHGHYQEDADAFAAWGFDALKADFVSGGPEGLDPRVVYPQFARAVRNNASGRPMLFNVCNFWNPGQIDGARPTAESSSYCNYQWAPKIAESWRTDTDIGLDGKTAWQWIMRNFDHNCAHPEVAGPGHWNDPDYIVPSSNLGYSQIRAYLSLWVVMAAPLMISADLAIQPQANIDLFTNREAIWISQDPLGAQATTAYRSGDAQVLVKPMVDGARAVCVLNRGELDQDVTVTTSMIGLPPHPM
ncbi:MAG: glycoside hydrolase family 27 protein, partial [Pseudonocardiales bacterium]|nr:glycoside hydrolase family 27 protein [Pseudonocardiales bacterium]